MTVAAKIPGWRLHEEIVRLFIEKENMSDLEQSIAEWRKQMLAVGIKSPTPLDELESHLRDEIERQAKLGMDEASAFDLAIKKIGAAPGIQIEFEKIEQARKARHFKRIYVLLMAIVVSSIFGCAVLFKLGSCSEMTVAQQISAMAALAVFYLMIWCGQASHRIFPALRAPRVKKVVPVLSIAVLPLWWVVFFNLILPHYNLDMSHLILAILWRFVTPTGAMMGLNLGIEMPARKNAAVA
jgi:hypothetical protein